MPKIIGRTGGWRSRNLSRNLSSFSIPKRVYRVVTRFWPSRTFNFASMLHERLLLSGRIGSGFIRICLVSARNLPSK